MEIENTIRWKILQQKVFERRICESFELFRGGGIEPILIKGWAAALNYPNVYDRVYTDVDLAVSENDYEKALELIGTKDWYIDLHKGLRHLDSLPWNRLAARTRLISLDNCAVRILSPEDHLRVMCVHWLNDGGAHRERLWDIYHAVASRPKDFDWEKCLGEIDAKREKWILCAIKLAELYLGLETGGTPAGQLNFDIPAWVIETVEAEWSREIKLKPLRLSMRNKTELFEQLRLRLPPNPIQATVEMSGEFDDNSRRMIQLKNVIRRFRQMLKRVINSK